MSKEKICIDKELEELVPNYLLNREKEYKELCKLLDLKEYDQIQKLAHKLAGNAGSYGFHQLSILGKRIEESCIHGNYDSVREDIELIKKYLDNIEVEYIET